MDFYLDWLDELVDRRDYEGEGAPVMPDQNWEAPSAAGERPARRGRNGPGTSRTGQVRRHRRSARRATIDPEEFLPVNSTTRSSPFAADGLSAGELMSLSILISGKRLV